MAMLAILYVLLFSPFTVALLTVLHYQTHWRRWPSVARVVGAGFAGFVLAALALAMVGAARHEWLTQLNAPSVPWTHIAWIGCVDACFVIGLAVIVDYGNSTREHS